MKYYLYPCPWQGQRGWMGIQETFTCSRTCDYNWAKGDLSKALFCEVTQKWARGQKVDLSEEKLWE